MTPTIRYIPPDFSLEPLRQAPAARTVCAERDGVLPDDFFATTNLPTYIKGAGGTWTMPREPRMDGVLVRDGDGTWWVREGRRVRHGDAVVVGRAEDGSEGVLVHAHGFQGEKGPDGEFHFMSSTVSREKPIDYTSIARMLVAEKRRGGHVLDHGPGTRALTCARQPRLVHPQWLRAGAPRGERGRRARYRSSDCRDHARHDERR